MPDTAPIPLHVSSAGSHFTRMAVAHDRLTVVAVFGQILHVTAGGDYGCVGTFELPNGPLNAIVDLRSNPQFSRLQVGDLITVDLPDDGPVRPQDVYPRVSADDQRAALKAVRSMIRNMATPDSLGPLALGLSRSDDPTARIARPRLADLERWLAERGAAPPHRPAPTGLVGLGPGLTPSGDDLLCGAMIALHSCGRWQAADELGAAVLAAAADGTSPFSRAVLAAAAGGEAILPLHATIDAILSCNARWLGPRVEVIASYGHTSGWDALSGAVLAIEAELAWPQPPDGPVGNALPSVA